MLGYRKKSFYQAHSLTETLRENPSDLIALKELQKLLLTEILRAEEQVRNTKTKLKSTQATDKRWNFLVNRIEGHRQCLYVWRCFGDAIAFLYLDKYALKQTFFNTDNQKAKNRAGFILGKEGLKYELGLLDQALKHNVPALLVDLTNTIRHGDVCLMGESDPFLIEVKSNKNCDRRGKRQKRSIAKLHSFFKEDICENLRGLPVTKRWAMQTPEIDYINQLNDCIEKAAKNGFGSLSPETGLVYIVEKNGLDRMNNVLSSLSFKNPIMFFLNMEKAEKSWEPYCPFTLLIRNREHLFSFIRGDLFIYILLDSGVFQELAKENGVLATIRSKDNQFELHLKNTKDDCELRVGSQLLGRIGMECVSPKWLLIESINRLRKLKEEGSQYASVLERECD